MFERKGHQPISGNPDTARPPAGPSPALTGCNAPRTLGEVNIFVGAKGAKIDVNKVGIGDYKISKIEVK